MRHPYLPVMMLFAVGVSAPAGAQVVTIATGTPVSTAITPDLVIARLMTFDRNGDGRLTADELPERMQPLLLRPESGGDRALDRSEVRGLALATSAQVPVLGGGQISRYGFPDFSFDSSRHIENAVDDLRLATDTRGRALDVVRRFIAGGDARAKNDLMQVMTRLLTEEQLASFRTDLETRTVNVPAIVRDGVTFFGATPEEAANQPRVMVRLRLAGLLNPEVLIRPYSLDATRKAEAVEAITRFNAHNTGRVNGFERPALVDELRGLLSDEQCDDLLAALGRPAVVKLAASPNITSLIEQVRLADPQAGRPVVTLRSLGPVPEP